MNDDHLIKQIKKLIEPLEESQKRLEQMQDKQGKDLFLLRQDVGELKFMRHDIKQLQMDNRSFQEILKGLELDNNEMNENVFGLKSDISGLKTDVSGLKIDLQHVDLKIEAFNKKMDDNKDEILSFMQYLYQNSVTHDQLAKVDARVKVLEKNL